jgi:glutamate-1-semialdehyde 2,1-aminomutase
MFGGFFTSADKVENYQQVMACDTDAFNRFFHGLLKRGIYIAPASYEAGFLSSAHSEEDIKATLEAATMTFTEL